MDGYSHPVAGIDYPRTFQEIDEWFRDDEACREYIRRVRWPKGFVCPHCGMCGAPWAMSDKLLRCRSCHARTSLTAGTIFEGTRKPLRTWFMAMWFVTSQKNGVSALGLQRALGLGSYETAWTWLHKLRRAMVRPGRDALSGTVEIDETYVGGPEKDKGAERSSAKPLSRLQPRRAARASAASDCAGSRTCRWTACCPSFATRSCPEPPSTPMAGEVMPGSKQPATSTRSASSAPVPIPRTRSCRACTRFASLLKRWLLGTHQGGVQRQHLDYYLDEFTFRFNRRRSNARGLLFHKLVEQAVAVDPATYRSIIGKPTNPTDSAASGQ